MIMCQSEGRSDFVYSVVKKTLNMENNTQIHTCSFQLTWYLTGKNESVGPKQSDFFSPRAFFFFFSFLGGGGVERQFGQDPEQSHSYSRVAF